MGTKTLYDRSYEHDNCGVGFIADINGRISHDIIRSGLSILEKLEHRGASGSDSKSGDGAGIMVRIPHDFFSSEAASSGIKLPSPENYGTGMFFFPRDEDAVKELEEDINETVEKRGGDVIFWRDVPVSSECLGKTALDSMPLVRQLFVSFPPLGGRELEKRLYLVRREIEKNQKGKFTIDQFYIPSFSAYTIIYKGLFVAPQLLQFYKDLGNPLFKSPFAIVHQRYSTNTFPSWPLAQPFRFIAHNGEINTIKGNIDRMKAREKSILAEDTDSFLNSVMPVINESLSDSGCFDNVYELLFQSGRSPEHSIMMMVPEPFSPEYYISQDRRAFYQYHAALMEPWDGPAALVFTDGEKIGATLDRNGLRPARWCITKDNMMVLASEAGVIDIEPENIRQKGRLSPGRMIIADIKRKRVLSDNEIKASVSRQKPYRKWFNENLLELKNLFQPPEESIIEEVDISYLSDLFGYTDEDLKVTLKTMAEEGHEPVISMGNDTPLAVLSEKPQLLYNYFKQHFAQVTNPPIDPLRERIVMSLMSFVGREKNLLKETEAHCRQLMLNHPVLTNDDIKRLIEIDIEGERTEVLRTFFYPSHENGKQLESAVEKLCEKAENRIDMGATFVVLSDKNLEQGQVPVPPLLAVSAVHNYLTRKKKRHLAGLIIETGEAREVMHFAALINLGASAVNPYLAFELISSMKKSGLIDREIKADAAFENYIEAVKLGLLKIMSKMGISTIRSFKGGGILEAVGLSSDLTGKYFPSVVSRIGGIGLDEIADEAVRKYRAAENSRIKEEKFPVNPGNLHYRRDGEKHTMSPQAIVMLQRAVRENDYSLYKSYVDEIENNSGKQNTIRSLFRFRKGDAVPLEEVEEVSSIVKRFVSSAMSMGSLSREAHYTLAEGMNRLGGMSNSGEGGEDEDRYKPGKNGSDYRSRVKQIASGRFGVTSNYLVNADELQIKIAQGAKPGEGGQLPGYKVDSVIARIRCSTPGVTLISPPPHHDIYSIEDLSQLIYDLRNGNPDARVSVKLVSEAGVGTVAAGVAKAGADMVLISGHDGGTGAAPVSSVKYAGLPWELGLAETQQTLVRNNLRKSVRIQVDGQMRTGRDVAVAALLGGEEFGFGTVSLVSLGCIMMRKCHNNGCPVGVATQDPELRKRFRGKPEHIMNFMIFTAMHLREIMASLGFRTLDEMTGRVEYLETDQDNPAVKNRNLDFSAILAPPDPDYPNIIRFSEQTAVSFRDELEDRMIKTLEKRIISSSQGSFSSGIRNINRSTGARLSSVVSAVHGSKGLPDKTLSALFTGTAGQSFGAFLAPGIFFRVEGEVNDYPGKGLSGGIISVTPPGGARFRASRNVIAGNAALYGATSGKAFFCGIAGERFCVRNSGAKAVVEGIGDHGCEYMTGGLVAVLGRTGYNFAAGMSGGIAYVLDEDQLFDTRCNLEMVNIEPIVMQRDKNELKSLITEHVDITGSEWGRNILFHWEEMWPLFVKVVPFEYGKIMEKSWEEEEKRCVYV